MKISENILVRKFSAPRFIVAAFILLAIILSLLLRLPSFNYILGNPYDTPFASSLVVLENWSTQAFRQHFFTPLITYVGEMNRYIWSSGVRFMNTEGLGYYVTAPPFSLILPFFIFKTLGLSFTELNLQLLNCFLHVIASLYIYSIVVFVTPREVGRTAAATIASCLFLLYGHHLWYYGNMYSWHIIWQYFWIISLYYSLHVVQALRSGRPPGRYLTFFFLSNFCAVYSDFQGVLFPAIFVLFLLFFCRRSKRIFSTLLVIIGSTFLPLLVCFLQYAEVSGGEVFLTIFQKGAEQSYRDEAVSLVSIVLFHYSNAYGLLALLVFSGYLGCRFLKPKEAKLTFSEATALVFSSTPVVLQHFLVLGWAASHPSSILRGSTFLFIFLGIVSQRLICFGLDRKSFRGVMIAFFLLLTSLWVFSINTYFRRVERNTVLDYSAIGARVAEHSNYDGVVFAITDLKLWLPLIYYSKRNIQKVESVQEARNWLKEHERKRGILFSISKSGLVEHQFVSDDL